MPALTTDGKTIHSSSRDAVTIFAPDGSPHVCAPVDAREILEAGLGYTADPPTKGAAIEQQPKQQPVVDNAVEQDAEGDTEPAEAPAVEDIEINKAVKVARRSRK